ncbi:MAG: hypothetical protein RMJ43_08145 [Chloroherpetonaceae bacterium]|nr:hypothetical protein [Chthonomonadaceae bacterium]MDW8207793.1 hypothetical protein [Chloroherpetonaceae bacterium]
MCWLKTRAGAQHAPRYAVLVTLGMALICGGNTGAAAREAPRATLADTPPERDVRNRIWLYLEDQTQQETRELEQRRRELQDRLNALRNRARDPAYEEAMKIAQEALQLAQKALEEAVSRYPGQPRFFYFYRDGREFRWDERTRQDLQQWQRELREKLREWLRRPGNLDPRERTEPDRSDRDRRSRPQKSGSSGKLYA